MDSERGNQILCQKICRNKRSNKKQAIKLFNECESAILHKRQVLLDSAKHLLRGILLESSSLHAEIVQLGDIEKIKESKKWLNELNEQGQVWLEREIDSRTTEMTKDETTELDKKNKMDFERERFLKNSKNSKFENMSTKSVPTKIGSGKFGVDQRFQTGAKNFPVDPRQHQTSKK